MRIDDPEASRVEALLGRSVAGTATEAEREELQLYVVDRPDLRERIEHEVARGELGRGWLERVHKDDAIARVEGSRRTRTERLVGLGLIGGGWGLGALVPFIGVPVLGAGVALMVYSLVRVRSAAHTADPYKDIVR